MSTDDHNTNTTLVTVSNKEVEFSMATTELNNTNSETS